MLLVRNELTGKDQKEHLPFTSAVKIMSLGVNNLVSRYSVAPRDDLNRLLEPLCISVSSLSSQE